MTQPPVVLSTPQQDLVTRALSLFAETHGWRLYALNVRSNHVHVVASLPGDGKRAIAALKAAATAALRRAGETAPDAHVWSRGGSVRVLGDPRAIEAACKYVVEDQGEDLGLVGGDF